MKKHFDLSPGKSCRSSNVSRLLIGGAAVMLGTLGIPVMAIGGTVSSGSGPLTPWTGQGYYSTPSAPATINLRLIPGFGPTGIFASCTACVNATTSFGQLTTTIGTYDLIIDGYNGGPVNQATSITPGSSIYSQQLSFHGQFNLTNGNNNLLSGNLNGVSIYAQPGSSSATIQFDLTNASSNVSTLPANPYFIVTGTTTSPVSISTVSIPVSPYSWTNFNNMTIDWSAKLSNTPYSVSSVPEPGEWALMLSGIGLMGFIATRRKTV